MLMVRTNPPFSEGSRYRATQSPLERQTGWWMDGTDSAVGRPVRDRLTLLAYGMAVASGFAVAALGPAMPSLREDLGISRAIGGLHFTALAVGAVVVGFTIQALTRARGRHWVFWAGGSGIAVGAAVIGASWSPAGTLFGAGLIGGALRPIEDRLFALVVEYAANG